MSGMRSTQPIEVTIDPAKAMQAGCEFFVTETEGVLTRGIIPPSAVITAVDTTKKDLPIYVADESLATRKSEPGTTFRAKREYEEAASASSGPPPLPQSAAAPKAVAEKKMPKSKPSVAKLEDVAMDYEDQATREGEPLDAAKVTRRATQRTLVKRRSTPLGLIPAPSVNRWSPTACCSASGARRPRPATLRRPRSASSTT